MQVFSFLFSGECYDVDKQIFSTREVHTWAIGYEFGFDPYPLIQIKMKVPETSGKRNKRK